MKKLFLYSAFFFLFAILSIALLFNSCNGITEPEQISANSAIYPQIPLNQKIKDEQGQHPPIIIDNQILVDLGGSDISDITSLIPIEEVDSCPCGDPDIKLLTLPDGFNPETAIATVRDNGDSRVKADKNFKFAFGTRPSAPWVVLPTELDLGFIDELEALSGTTEPVIAIVDTGIFPNAFRKNEITLFKSSTGCDSETAGWNFVDNNNDVSDDNMHGTFVAKRIAKRIKGLDTSAGTTTNYKVLPLKVFSNGRGEYFNVVCAFSYIQQLIENEEVNIPLINASFGSSLGSFDLSDLLVLKKYIDELNQSTIIVASAGNEGEDNTQIPHFPSGYNNQINFGTADIEPSKNIVAVAGHESINGQIQLVPKTIVDPKIGSNFGKLNVDLAAPWVFQMTEDKENGQSIVISGLQGTSYSAAYVSGDLLHFMVNNTNNSTLSPPIPTFLSEYYNNNRINTANIQVIGGKYLE